MRASLVAQMVKNLVCNVGVKVKVAQSCPVLCDPMNYTVHGILQTRILEWVAFFPSPGDFPNPGIELRSPALQVDALPVEPPGKPPDKIWKQPKCPSTDEWKKKV